MSEWVRTTEELPPMGRYVLARYNGGNWIDREDPYNVNCVVVKRIPTEVRGNDHVPYRYTTFGPGSFFAQDISHWALLPRFPEKD